MERVGLTSQPVRIRLGCESLTQTHTLSAAAFAGGTSQTASLVQNSSFTAQGEETIAAALQATETSHKHNCIYQTEETIQQRPPLTLGHSSCSMAHWWLPQDTTAEGAPRQPVGLMALLPSMPLDPVASTGVTWTA